MKDNEIQDVKLLVRLRSNVENKNPTIITEETESKKQNKANDKSKSSIQIQNKLINKKEIKKGSKNTIQPSLGININFVL